MANESTNTPPPTPPAGSETPPSDKIGNWDEWLGAQPENVRALYDTHTAGLKSALTAERGQREDLTKQLRATAKELQDGSEARKALDATVKRLESEQARADFYEEGSKPEIGCTNLKLAWLAAQNGEYAKRGRMDWAGLKADCPELFKVTPPAGNAGNGTTQSAPGKLGMNDFIRRQAGRV